MDKELIRQDIYKRANELKKKIIFAEGTREDIFKGKFDRYRPPSEEELEEEENRCEICGEVIPKEERGKYEVGDHYPICRQCSENEADAEMGRKKNAPEETTDINILNEMSLETFKRLFNDLNEAEKDEIMSKINKPLNAQPKIRNIPTVNQIQPAGQKAGEQSILKAGKVCYNCGREISGEEYIYYHGDQDDMVCEECAKILTHDDTAYAGLSVYETGQWGKEKTKIGELSFKKGATRQQRYDNEKAKAKIEPTQEYMPKENTDKDPFTAEPIKHQETHDQTQPAGKKVGREQSILKAKADLQTEMEDLASLTANEVDLYWELRAEGKDHYDALDGAIGKRTEKAKKYGTECKYCGKKFDRLYQGEYEDMGLGDVCDECIKNRKLLPEGTIEEEGHEFDAARYEERLEHGGIAKKSLKKTKYIAQGWIHSIEGDDDYPFEQNVEANSVEEAEAKVQESLKNESAVTDDFIILDENGNLVKKEDIETEKGITEIHDALVSQGKADDPWALAQWIYQRYGKSLKKAYALPIVEHKGKRWYVDQRLGELRNVDDPNDILNYIPIEFQNEEATEIDKSFNIQPKRNEDLAEKYNELIDKENNIKTENTIKNKFMNEELERKDPYSNN